MQLNLKGIKETELWKNAGIVLPSYDVEKVVADTKEAPVWVHFGAGNIFRIFIGGLADKLIGQGDMEKGLTCVETFDFDVIDKIYNPYDNLVLAVTLKADASTEKQVIGSLTEAIKAVSSDPTQWDRLKTIFVNPGLQMISFTITEKGYALSGPDGKFFPLSRPILTMVRQRPVLLWQWSVLFCGSVIRPASCLWRWCPWITALITGRSCRAPLSPWLRSGRRRAMWMRASLPI